MKAEICLVCGGAYTKSKLPGLVVCRDCGFISADLAISSKELEALYSAKYFSGDEYHDYVAERRIIERNFQARLRAMLPYVRKPRASRLFEIGCAYGFFLSVAAPHFGSVEGIDISRDAVKYAVETLGVRAQAGDFLTHDIPDQIDVACLWDTIEHLQSPDLYLAKLAELMRPGGVVAVTTGDIGSMVARLRGKRWRQIHPPTHLHYFSRQTLELLLRKHGFEVRHCEYEGMYRSLDTIAYIILNIKRQWPGVYQALKRAGLLKWDVYLNLHDIVFIVAEKK